MGNRRTARARNTGSSDVADGQKIVRFALDDIDYEVELPAEDAAALRAVLSEYASKGRKTTPRRPRTPAAVTSSAARSRDEVRRIRQWAVDHGYTPNPRGRLAQSIIDAYGER